MLALFLLTAGLPAATSDEIVLPDRYIRVGDVAQAPGYESEVLGMLSQQRTSLELDEGTVRRMLRNRFPALQFVLRFNGRVRLSRPALRTVHRGNCYAALIDLPAGEPITISNAAAVECPSGKVAAALGYDAASSSTFAREFIPAGANLGALRLNQGEVVPEGKAITLRYAAGPVIVERKVTMLQPGVRGGRVFVKTDDGEVITTRLSLEQTGASQ
ncbi:hypothetical protein [Altererythrobacter sp. Z27]|uniref:hypothetical protein n=1 Tax=Altererythrobacter sp. Z27 TaxID=3461147 RepID=UPI0040444FCC